MSGSANSAGDRRGNTLRRLAALRDAADPCRAAAAVLADNPCDIPFAAIYCANPAAGRVSLCATVGVELCGWQFPCGFAAHEPDADPRLPLAATLREGRPRDSGDLSSLGLRVTNLLWGDEGRSAVLLPMPSRGLLVAGVSPRQALDAAYRQFLTDVAELIGQVL